MDALSLLISNVRDNKVSSDQQFNIVYDRLDNMETKIDKLLAFKWQIIGGSIVMSVIAGSVFQIIIAMIGRK